MMTTDPDETPRQDTMVVVGEPTPADIAELTRLWKKSLQRVVPRGNHKAVLILSRVDGCPDPFPRRGVDNHVMNAAMLNTTGGVVLK